MEEAVKERMEKLENQHHNLDKRLTVAESNIRNIEEDLSSIKTNTSKTYYTLIVTLVAIIGFFIKYTLY